MRRYFKYEINILKKLNRPNIVKLEEVKTNEKIIIILLWNILTEVNYQIILKNIN